MAIYCGVDFHARQQTVCYCDTTDGEIRLAELDHQADDVRGFYSRFTGELLVGIEAGASANTTEGQSTALAVVSGRASLIEPTLFSSVSRLTELCARKNLRCLGTAADAFHTLPSFFQSPM